MIYLFFIALIVGVHGCASSDDPFIATISFNSQEDMWRADAIVAEYNSEGEIVRTFPQRHWETRTLGKNCVLIRTVYLPFKDIVYVYRQRIFPSVEGTYQIQELIPQSKRYQTVDCRVFRIDHLTVNVTSRWTDTRQITVVDPHYSFHESVRMPMSETMTIYTAVSLVQQEANVVEAREAYEQGSITEMTIQPLPSFIFRIKTP